MARLFSQDPVTKTRKLFHWDSTNDSFLIETRQDVTDVVETNRALYNRFDERTPWKGDWHHVARVPFVAFYEWLQRRHPDIPEGEAYRLFTNDQRLMSMFLNDRDNSAFRTRPGVV